MELSYCDIAYQFIKKKGIFDGLLEALYLFNIIKEESIKEIKEDKHPYHKLREELSRFENEDFYILAYLYIKLNDDEGLIELFAIYKKEDEDDFHDEAFEYYKLKLKDIDLQSPYLLPGLSDIVESYLRYYI